jgi:hypothetical protein
MIFFYRRLIRWIIMSSKGKYIGIGIGIAVVAVVAIVLMGGMLSGSKVANSSSIIPQEHRQNIVNGMIGVKAGGYQAYPFYAPDGSSDVSVKGNFEARGGSGNDIKVAILDQQAYTNWKNGHQVNAYYSSGKLTTSTLNEGVPSGEQMYLVFDNQFSTFSSKDVRTSVDLVYTN